MVNDFDIAFALNFLNKHYPITKVKHLGRFKRGIVIDNNSFVLNDAKLRLAVFNSLSAILNIVLGFDEDVTTIALASFLPKL